MQKTTEIMQIRRQLVQMENAAGIALTGQYPNSRNFGFNVNVTFKKIRK
ncbi:hypothetical protein [Chryseobacterium wanjuense]